MVRGSSASSESLQAQAIRLRGGLFVKTFDAMPLLSASAIVRGGRPCLLAWACRLAARGWRQGRQAVVAVVLGYLGYLGRASLNGSGV